VLKDVSTLEQRYDVVRFVMKDGFSFTEISAKFSASRHPFYRWLAE
jgi:hypothetical protein